MKPTPVILDTDIGDDIDDALALGLILASPELKLLGVTTVFEDVYARARQARTILAAAGIRDIPVAAGCGATIGTCPVEGRGLPTWQAGKLPSQDSCSLPESELFPLDRRHGVDFLIETIMAGDGDIVPITIGALTNMAMALVKEPKLLKKIPKIVTMAAEIRHPMAEWNILCDPQAADIVFRSGIPMDVTTFYIGEVAEFGPEHFARLDTAVNPVAKLLAKTVKTWVNGGPAKPRLFDPLAVATMMRPELCTWKQGRIEVELKGQSTFAFTRFHEDKSGPHRVAWDCERNKALDYYFERTWAYKGASAAARK